MFGFIKKFLKSKEAESLVPSMAEMNATLNLESSIDNDSFVGKIGNFLKGCITQPVGIFYHSIASMGLQIKGASNYFSSNFKAREQNLNDSKHHWNEFLKSTAATFTLGISTIFSKNSIETNVITQDIPTSQQDIPIKTPDTKEKSLSPIDQFVVNQAKEAGKALKPTRSGNRTDGLKPPRLSKVPSRK